MSPPSSLPALAVIGGSGQLGAGLALRWARHGYPVTIGSRDAARARDAAAELTAAAGRPVQGAANAQAAQQGQIIVVTVPFAAQAQTLGEIAEAARGKILIDTTAPLVPPKVMRVQLPPEGSAAQRAQALLGDAVRVVSAFQTVAAAHLRDPQHTLEGDVLVSGNDRAARAEVITLAQALGLPAWHAGPLDNAAVAEGLTSVLIFLNKHYGFDGAGIRICGRPKSG